jgi:hypothetical protein
MLLFEVFSFIDLLEGQVLLLLYFSSHSRKLIIVWEEEMWGGNEARELLLDRLLSGLFKKDPNNNRETRLNSLWWVNTKKKDLLKLWISYKKIISTDDPT